ncbi:MAG: CARDB domain-containing protein [Candidatus Poseidoniia archaeon]|nr:CARDB domain-containing protein [Candidatus Poseidoniia archaeon]
MLRKGLVAMVFFSFLLLAQPSQAETSEDFNDLNLFFYGDLDSGNGNISTLQPTSDSDTQSDCPQEANRLSWPGQDRQWTSVGSWIVDLETPGSFASGEHMFTIWANSTQGTVEDVQFRISVTIGGGTADAQATSQSKTITDSAEEATQFEISFDLTNESFNQDPNDNDQLEVEIEYSGGDPGQNPVTGGQSTEQIVILTSSIEHPASISEVTVNHFYADFPIISIEDSAERVAVSVMVWSAFGTSDIDSNEWTLGVVGASSGNQGYMADFNMKSMQNGSYKASFYWYYNDAQAISDTYSFYIQAKDIQNNHWKVFSDQEIYLVIHGYEIDNVISPGNIQINNQTGISKVKAGNSFTIDITVSAEGDPLVAYNPIPVTVIWISGSNEIVLYETAVFATPGASASTSFRYTFDTNGEYLIKVVIDRNNVVIESNENNNVAEFILVVAEPEKEDFIQSLIDEVTEGGTVTLLVFVSVSSIVLAGYFATRGKEEQDFDWEEDDDF